MVTALHVCHSQERMQGGSLLRRHRMQAGRHTQHAVCSSISLDTPLFSYLLPRWLQPSQQEVV
jgi:hypothetical protein